ncbi:MAG TPA: Sec-independent protein translocase protein TatB [Hyphomicrobiaceae bacterium]|nr:Sec-independent protein translocase protein TatB [Hyphomicrobiaceae bacterium]
MFDISWSEILIIGIVALLVVGPKELPALLRTIGRYAGMVKRQAAEFRAQFDEAMRETELEQLKRDVENIKADAEATLRDAERSVETEIVDAKRELDAASATSTRGNGKAVPDVEGGGAAEGPPPAADRPAEPLAPKSGAEVP